MRRKFPKRRSTTPESPDDLHDRDNIVVFDDLDGQSLSDAIDATIVEFDDGDIVKGRVVKIDSDEVLLDIGFKSEGVIPSRELSIRNDVDPHEVVSLDESSRRSCSRRKTRTAVSSFEEARAVRARVGHDRGDQGIRGRRLRPGHRGRQGWAHPRHRLRGFLPASLVDLRRVRDLQPVRRQEARGKIIELDKNRNNVVLTAARTSRRRSASSVTSSSPT